MCVDIFIIVLLPFKIYDDAFIIFQTIRWVDDREDVDELRSSVFELRRYISIMQEQVKELRAQMRA